MDPWTPTVYLSICGLDGYDKHFVCKKNHKYIDTCIKHAFSCTINKESGVDEQTGEVNVA